MVTKDGRVTVQVPVTVDLVNLWSEVFGTSGESHPWWQEVEFLGEADWNRPGEVRLVMRDPDSGEEDIAEKTVGPDDVVKAVGVVVATCVDACTGRPIRVGDHMDWDSCVSDCVMQQMVLGEVRFS